MIRKLQRQQAQNRPDTIKTGLVGSKRSIIDGTIGFYLNPRTAILVPSSLPRPCTTASK